MNAVRRIFAVIVGAWFCAGAYGAAIINDTEIERHLTELVEPLADAAGIANTAGNGANKKVCPIMGQTFLFFLRCVDGWIWNPPLRIKCPLG